jgi:broad specificity phosphatase PhoE
LFLGAEADIGLSERGLRGAKEITPTLALHFPAAIIRSPMRRALETPPPSV